jgi:hypothetical protein
MEVRQSGSFNALFYGALDASSYAQQIHCLSLERWSLAPGHAPHAIFARRRGQWQQQWSGRTLWLALHALTQSAAHSSREQSRHRPQPRKSRIRADPC